MRKIYINLKKREDFNLIKFLGKKKFIRIELKIFTYILIILSFLTQYISEYLFFGIVTPFININQKNLNTSDKYILNFFNEQIYFNKTLIMILNIFSFIVCFLSDYLILYLNDSKGFLSHYGIDIYSNGRIRFCSLLLTIFQPLIGFSYLFTGKKRDYIRIGICIAAILLCLIFLLLSFRQFNYYFDSIIPLFIFILVCFSFYAGLFELILLNFIKKKEQMTQNYSIVKFLLNLITSIFIFSISFSLNKNMLSKQLSKNLFKIDEKNRDIGEIYLYIKYYCKLREDPSDFELYKIFYNHKKKCQMKDCFCSLIKKRLNIKKIFNSLKKDEYSIIGEQEIVNRIYYLFKTKNFKKEIEDYLLLHCQYIFAVRKREYYSLYLCSMYLNCSLNLSILTKYFLYETKKEILFKIKSNKDIYKSNLLIGNMKNIRKNIFQKIMNLKFIEHFIIFSENIKYLIKDILKNLEIVLAFRKHVQNNSKLRKMTEKSFINFLKICEKIQKNDENIKKTIINYIKTRRKGDSIIKNNEISYILTNYFILLHKKIPSQLKNKFLFNYKFLKISKFLYKDFSEFNMNYPIIISQNKFDNFDVIYMHYLLSNYLDYTQEEIKDKDLNEFIPLDIRKEHTLLLKQFTLLHNPKYKTNHTYILSKGNYLINISLHCRILPNLNFFLNLIVNVRIIQNENNLSLSYHIFLDKKGYFMSICKEFEKHFFFDIKRIKQLSITFNDFFGIPPLGKKNNKEPFNFLFEEDKAHSIFNTIPNEKMFYLRKKKKTIEQLKRKKYHFSTNINKKNISIGINNVNRIFDEKGLDNEWYNRTKCLAQRFKSSEDNSPLLKKRRERKKTVKSLFNNNNVGTENIFSIDYYLKEIGNKKYYMIKMTENTDINLLKKSTYNLNKIIEKQKKKPLMQSNTVQLTTKRSEVSQISSSQISSHTNINLLHSPLNEDFLNDNNFSFNNISQINEISVNTINNSSSFNNSLINNSKIPLNEDSKNGFSGLNLIQNLANNEIARINPIKHNQSEMNNLYSKRISKLSQIENDKQFDNNPFLKKFIQNYTFFLCISFCIVITISLFTLFLKIKKIYEHKDLFQFNIFMEILKTDTYLSSLYSFTLCFQASFKTQTIDTRQFIGPKKKSLQNTLTKFNVYINKIKSNSKLSILYYYLYGNYDFSLIDKNWKISKRQSNLIEEAKLILYDLYQIYYIQNNTCNFMKSFFNKNYENLDTNDSPPTELEQLTFYGFQNTLQNFKNIFENTTSSTSEILFEFYKKYTNYILFYGILIIFFTFICYCIILEKLKYDKKEIKRLLKYLFDIDENNENQILFEIQVFFFKIMCENFNQNNIMKFEQFKKEETIASFNGSQKKSSKKNKKNNMNKLKKSLTNDKNLPKTQDENNINNVQEIEKNIFLPKSVTISYIILTFFLIFISSTVIINIVYAYLTKKTFIFAVIMAMNFLERIPKSFELLYYAIISFTFVDSSFIGSYNNYNQSELVNEYINYYHIKLILENNSQIFQMKESYFPNLFFDGKKIENNLQIFLGKKTIILNNVKRIEKEFNSLDNLCYSSSINSLNEIIEENLPYKEYFTQVSEKLRLCYKYNFGSNKYGLLTELNFIYQEITNLYYDFILSEDRISSSIKSFNSSDISRMCLDFDYVLENVFKSYSFFVMKDIDDLYIKVIRLENIFSVLLLLIVFFVVFYIFFFIGRENHRYKKLFLFFHKMY